MGITSKVRKAELSFLYATSPLVLFYISTKYHKNIPKGLSYRANMKSKKIMPKVGKAELSFLYVTRRLVLFYISTKYHNNIPKGLCLTEQT